MAQKQYDTSNLGATYQGDGKCYFLVWAPLAHKVEVHLLGSQARLFPLAPVESGYHQAMIDGVMPGDTYLYRLDGRNECPDPASRHQPEGVLGPSEVIDTSFHWDDSHWFGLHLEKYIIYELHTGTFSQEGTFAAVIPYLDELNDLGITAIEIMPVAQFSGNRNWGYDGAYPFAVQNSYGGYRGLKQLVNACHQKGLAVILDVVYNHFGPEGNYCRQYGPYYTNRYKTAWGNALNFDEPQSDEVRRFFIENALYWITDFHIDALRLDAVHTILDFSPTPFLQKLADAICNRSRQLHRNIYIIAESDSNNARLVTPKEMGGYGLNALWSDDFHHSLHALLTGEQMGYYKDFGKIRDLATAIREGFVYSGQYSRYREHCHGSSPKNIPSGGLVICSQNHDQIGNRASGDRLSCLVSLNALKLAAGVVLLAPSIPLLFMGEEYGETAPFPYFISHLDPKLAEAVRVGRKGEFASFGWRGEIPDPQNESTYSSARINRQLKEKSGHKILFDFYRDLIRLRKSVPALANPSKEHLEVISYEKPKILFFRRWDNDSEIITAFNFDNSRHAVYLPVPEGDWHKLIDSQEPKWSGTGSSIPQDLNSEGGLSITLGPQSFVLFGR